MEAQQLFSLDAALADWRTHWAALPAEDLAELESHLVESVAELRSTGLSEPEAFAVASQRLGYPHELIGAVRESLLEPTVTRRAPLPIAKILMGLGGLGLIGGFALVLAAALLPRQYAGTVLLEIRRVSPIVGAFAEDSRPLTADEVKAQFRTITSKETLLMVIKKLALTQRWKAAGLDSTYQKLRAMIETEEEPGTALITVRVYSLDREEAAELANEVVSAYVLRRQNVERDRLALAFQTLTQVRKVQTVSVARAADQLQEVIRKHQIVDFSSPGQPRPAPTAGEGMVEEAVAAMETKQKEIQDYKAQLELLANKSGDQLIAAAASMQILDPKTSAIYSAFLEDQKRLGEFALSGLGSGHPDFVELSSRLNAVREQLEEGISMVRSTLDEKLKMAETVLANIRKIANQESGPLLADRQKYDEYQQAKDNYAQQTESLRKVARAQEDARLANLMPLSPATIHETATPASTYAKPAVPALLTGAGVVATIGLALLLMGLARRRHRGSRVA